MLDRIALILTVAGGFASVIPTYLVHLRARRKRSALSHPEYTRITRALKDRAGDEHEDIDTLRESVRLHSLVPGRNTSALVLSAFSVVVVLFAILTIWRYWRQVVAMGDNLFLALGLLLIMVGGMFVQVLTSNYTEDKPLFQISASQLLFPLLFSPIVFYPIWLVGEKHGAQMFSFYAAFLNGYFWQSVVSQIKRPPAGSGDTP